MMRSENDTLIYNECVSWDNGDVARLLINGVNGSLRIASWCDDFACEVNMGQEWQALQRDPHINILHDDAFDRTDSPLFAFLQTIPQKVRNAAKRFQWMQFTCMRLMRQSPFGIQIATSAPVFFWLVAVCVGLGRWSIQEGATLLLDKRKDVLANVFPPQPAFSQKSFSKMVLDKYGREDFLQLQRLASDVVAGEAVRHLSVIRIDLLRAVKDMAWTLSIRILREVLNDPQAKYKDMDHAVYEVQRTVHMGELAASSLYAVQPGSRIEVEAVVARCPDLGKLKGVYDHWLEIKLSADRPAPMDLLGAFDGDYPEPLFPGTDHIRPIENYRELFEEGETMNHCIYAYADGVKRKKVSVYKIFKPQRATLALINDDGIPRIIDIRGKCNKEVSSETSEAVSSWLIRFR